MGSRTRKSHENRSIATITAKRVYENIITAIDVFSRYTFDHLFSNPTAVKTGKIFIEIMTRHTYLPTLNVKDKGSVFVSQVIHEVAEILGINLKHATTKHAQTIGVPEPKLL